ncbi:MAG: DMT family transporter [Anaerolineales bacterium]
MPFAAILLLFFSALLHTAWNLLLKQAGRKYIATWWAILLGAGLLLPVLLFTGVPARETWPLLLSSVLVETAYFVVLSLAYREADFSLVYPLARGAAPLMTAVWSVLFLQERLTPGGVAGLGIVVLGLVMVGGSNLLTGMQTPRRSGILLSLLLALLISVYSVIDGAAVKQTPAFAYTVLVFFLSPVLAAPLVFKRYGWQTLKSELTQDKVRILAIGILTVSAYLLTLAAYAIAKVSYSGAVREVSVVMGALAGWLFLGENLVRLRVWGALVIFGGILCITLAG